jgi:type IV fimbrial biogenesis protein FimT
MFGPDTARVAGLHRGFTLIELMITLSILTVLLLLAAPSYREYTANQRVKSLSNDLLVSLRFARNEAVKRNASVSVVADDAGWAAGWSIQDGDGSVIRNKKAAASIWSVAEASNIATITFDREGRSAVAAVFSVCDSAASALVKKRLVSLSASGVPRVSLSGNCGGG